MGIGVFVTLICSYERWRYENNVLYDNLNKKTKWLEIVMFMDALMYGVQIKAYILPQVGFLIWNLLEIRLSNLKVLHHYSNILYNWYLPSISCRVLI